MKRRLLIPAILLVAIVFSSNGFCATYDATGIWEYSTSDPWNDCGPPSDPETGLTAFDQNGDTFTYTDRWGIFNGRVTGANYTATNSYPENFGVTTNTINFTLTSNTTGSGTVTWIWTDGFEECRGGSTVTGTRQPTDTTYDATGIWDYSTSNHWNDCGDLNNPETGSVSITQNGSKFRFVYNGTQLGQASAVTYIAVAAYPEDQGTTTESIFFTLSSNTSGSGNVGWLWTDGSEYCYGGNDFTINKRTEPNNPPYKPTLLTPTNGTVNASLTPDLMTNIFVDPDSGDQHKQTEWQISKQSDFSTTVLNTIRDTSLISFVVPKFVLVKGTTYYWRTRFYDNHFRASDWSNIRTFTTLATTNDQNGNGIPDHQENPEADLDRDGVKDSQQEHIKSLNTFDGNFQMGVSIKDDPTVITIGSIESIDPATISDLARPSFVPFGLFGAELAVLNPSDPGEVTFYFSQPAEQGVTWFVYNPVDGWVDFSRQATFSPDRRSVKVNIKDWGYGDADGLPNGTVFDPCGFGIASWINGLVTDSSMAQPINNAVISIDSLEINTLSDGHYLSMIRSGTFSISASANCYESSAPEQIVILEGATFPKDFALVKSIDSDGDGAPNTCDAFPNDNNEWLDTDGDGIGNQTDSDDDNDGMPDDWEQLHALNPLVNDAAEDDDGDGYSNLREYRFGSDPHDPDSKPTFAMHSIALLLLLF